MRAVMQRVKSASVTVGGKQISSIGRGLLVLIGITTSDKETDLNYITSKILGCRLFPGESGEEGGNNDMEEAAWKKNVVEAELEVLCVSQLKLQFTLFASTKKGKPDFRLAMSSEQSQIVYNSALESLRSQYVSERIKDGQFGAMMDVALVNDGPVTILLDSAIDGPKPLDDKAAAFALQKKKKQEEIEERTRLNAERKAKEKSESLEKRFKEAMTEQY